MNNADTAANAAIAASGETPNKIAVGYNAVSYTHLTLPTNREV